MPSGALHYLITDFNVSADKAQRWETFFREHCECVNGQEEKCPETGRHHYQIYLKLKKKRPFKWIKATLQDEEIHAEVCRNVAAAWDYGGKDETRVAGGWSHRAGDPPVTQGHRSDLDGLRGVLERGGIDALVDEHFGDFIKYSKGLRDAEGVLLSRHHRDWKTHVWVFVGPPGCGKSSLVRGICAELGLELYVKLNSEKWFDYYHPLRHSAVLLDDFTGNLHFSQLLGICDRGDCYVEVKGATKPFLARHIFITSNALPEEWYNFAENKKIKFEALHRRIDSYWDAFADVNFNKDIGVGPGFPEVQGPKSPVILGGDLGLSPLYHGEGKWTFEEIRIAEDSE